MPDPYFYPGPKRIAAACALAGFPEEDIVTMVAIHGAETSGNVWAVSPMNPNGTRDYGAFQISGRTPPENWVNYFENAKLAYDLYAKRRFAPWFGYAKIDQVFGLAKHPDWTYRDWAMAGYAKYQAELAKGYKLHRIASCYLLEDGL